MLRFHDHHELSALLDYVDAPAQEVIDRTARSQAQRISDETRAELDKVLRRVENIYGSFEMMDQAISQAPGTNVEYVNDLMELEEVIKDKVKKKKYQQQVTIFVVGYENVCSTRLRLIQQVNEFFMETTATMAVDIPEEPLDVEDSDKEEALFDSLSSQMEESITSCHQLSDRLAEVNKEMVDFLAAYAQNKLSNNKPPPPAKGGKKKMEKALEQARNEMAQLSEKLLNTQDDLQEKEDRIQQLYKQMEMKNIECQKYKTAAEAMKKSVMEAEALRESLSQKDMDIRRLQTKISELSIEVQENEQVSEIGHEKMREQGHMSQQKLSQLETQLQSKSIEMAETQREMQKRFDEKVNALQQQHKVEIEHMKHDHAAHIKYIKHGGESRDSFFDETAVTKWMSDDDEEAVYKSKSHSRSEFPKSRQSTLKEPSRLAKELSKSPRQSVAYEADVIEFDDEFELDDEAAWSSIPRHHVVGRFKQYRQLTQSLKVTSNERMDSLKKITDRKVQTLKGQFQEHKTRWMKERDILIRAIDASENHREVAQGFAERAVDQMETMIATAEEQDSMAPLTEPSERESVMRARVSALEIANADLLEKLGRTKEIAHNFEAQLNEKHAREDQAVEEQLASDEKDEKENETLRTLSTKSKRVTITSAYEDDNQTPEAPQLERTRSLVTRHSTLDSISTVGKLDIGVSDLHSFHTVDTVVEEREDSGRSRSHDEEEEDNEEETFDLQLERDDSSLPERITPSKYSSSASERGPASTRASTGVIKDSGTRHSSAVSAHLSEARQAAAESRQGLAASEKSAQSRAAVVSTTRQVTESYAENMELDENADMPFPPDPHGWPVEDKIPARSTASSLLQKEIPLASHPIVQEYVRTYEHLMEFKEKLGSMLQDKDLMSHASTLTDLEMMTLKEDSQIAPQVEEMGRSIVMVLDQTLTLVRQMLSSIDRDYAVSSLRLSEMDSSTLAGESQRAVSRTTFQTLPTLGENSAENEKLRAELADLHQKYNELKGQLDNSNKLYENQLNQNTTIMMEMQGTIANLKRELTSMNESNITGRRTASARDGARSRPSTDGASVAGAPTLMADGPEPSVIFTRLDYERNSKSLKRAVTEARLDAESYQDALQKMEEYTRIPVQRLGFIVRKYLHQHTMRRIQENAKRHKSLNAEVFQMWDNMEHMEMKRQRRYADIMEFLTQERLRLAQVLVDTFESIEERCSIFLIKPVLSLKSREQLHDYYVAMMRLRETENRQRRAAEEQELRRRAMAGVHPTPEVTRTSLTREMPSLIRGSSLKEPKAAPPTTYWSPMTAQNGQNYLSDSLTTINTPRLLEMDVNRILLGQNNVSVQMPGSMPAHAPPQMSVRTYISVARPSSQPKVAYMYDVDTSEKARSSSKSQSQKVPPSTPLDRGVRSASTGKGGRRSRSSKDLSGNPPLPPITPTPRIDSVEDGEFEEEEEEEEKVTEETPATTEPQKSTLDKQEEPQDIIEKEQEQSEQEEANSATETPRIDVEGAEDAGGPSRPLSAVVSITVSPRTQTRSSDNEREDSFLPSSHSVTSNDQ